MKRNSCLLPLILFAAALTARAQEDNTMSTAELYSSMISGDAGSGTWSGTSTADRCRGRWEAERR